MKNRIIKFSVDRQRIAASDVSVVADSRNYLSAWFTFDETWDGVEKTAVFSQGENVYNMLLTDDMCRIPAEVITGDGFYVSVFGGDLITADKIKIAVTPSGLAEGVAPPVPTQSIYDQMLNLVASEAAIAAGSAEEAADSAKTAKTWADESQKSARSAAESAEKLNFAADAVEGCIEAADKANGITEGYVVIEQNAGSSLKVWVGTKAEYDALESTETNCLYIITDDTLGDRVLDEINALKVDYIVEQGTYEHTPQTVQQEPVVWTYRKWASGIAECWGNSTERSYSITEQYESIFVNNDSSRIFIFPPALFKENSSPVVTAEFCSTNYGVPITSVNSPWWEAVFIRIADHQATERTGNFSVKAIGRWK